MNTNIYIGESPLQVLNIHEARQTFKAESHILIIRNKPDHKEGKINRALIQKEIEKESWDEIIEIPYDKTISNIQSAAGIVKKLKKKNITAVKVFLGDIRNSFNRITAFNLHPEEILLVDDGSSIIHTQSRYVSDGGYIIKSNRFLFLLKNIRNFIFWQIRNPRNLNYNIFSIYQLQRAENQKCYENTYRYTQEKIKKKDLIPRNETVYFLGSALSEDKKVSEEYYLQQMQKAAAYFAPKKIYYLPHRRESETKLQKLIEENNFEMVRFDKIVERGFADNGIKPEIIASFYSTALVTVPFLYNCKAISFRLDYNEMTEQDFHEISQIYDEYKKLMPVIELEKEQHHG